MMRITLMDGTTQEIDRDLARGIFPWRAPLVNPRLKSAAAIFHQGRMLPVHGPLAEASAAPAAHASERPWFLYLGDHVRVIRGLPTFADDIALNLVPAPTTRPAPALVEDTEAASPEASVPAVAAIPPPTPLVTAKNLARSEEEEEAQVLQELEDLLRAS